MKKLITSLSLALVSVYTSVAVANTDLESANKVYNQAVSLVSVGKKMEALRGSTNVDENLQCSQTMKINIQKVRVLKTQADALAVSHFQLKLAAIELHSCITCATDALESCSRADDALNEFSSNN